MTVTDIQQRRLIALEQRRSGRTYRAIGKELGVSSPRARQIVQLALRDEAPASATEEPATKVEVRICPETRLDRIELTKRTANVLKNCGFETVGDLMQSDRESFRHEMLRVPNCNRRSWLEIERVLARVQTE